MSIVDKSTFPEFHFKRLSTSISDPSANYHLTREAAEVLSVVLEQLEAYPSPQRGVLLFSNDPGVDRSRLLRYLGMLLEDRASPQWTPLLRHLNLSDHARPKASIRSLFIQVPKDPSIDLRSFFLETLWQEIPATAPGVAKGTPDELQVRMRQVSTTLVKQSLGLIVLENISERIRQLNDAAKFQRELQVYRSVFDAFSQSGVLTVLMAEKEHFSPDRKPYLPLESEESIERCYSWIDCSNAATPGGRTPAGQEEEFQGRLQLLIYDWIQSRIPSWKPERSPVYQHSSQALAATLLEGDRAIPGLVYFKSIFDPYWSDEDIARLKGSAPAWVLTILSPCERFYEFENKIKEMLSRLPVLLVWRPDTPAKAEIDALRSLVFGLSGQLSKGDLPDEESVAKIRLILFDLYIKRGRLIDSSRQYSFDIGSKSQTIGRQLSARLGELSLRKPGVATRVMPASAQGDQAHRWATLLADGKTGETSLKWLVESAGELSKRLPNFPEDFKTTRFWSEIKSIRSPLGFIDSTSPISFFDFVSRLGRTFAWNEERLLKWRDSYENLLGLVRWVPAFVHAREYLDASFPLGGNSDSLREKLLGSLENPHLFLDSNARRRFDETFQNFKKNYINAYYTLHENALHLLSVLKKDERKIDFVALRNLELLSGLPYTDKSYLNRVKLLAKWIQGNNCSLPVREILKLYPRCYCNFNPCTQQKLTSSAAEINAIIQDGIEYFRQALRKSAELILSENKDRDIEDQVMRQITALLGEGVMVPLTAESIKVLQEFVVKYPRHFRRHAAGPR